LNTDKALDKGKLDNNQSNLDKNFHHENIGDDKAS
jgi:hypothetical protein